MAARAEATRERLQACALELFAARGFDRTSVADVARAAGVSHMTFFRHFPTKEAVVLDDPYDPAIAAAVAAQPRELPALERVRRGFLAAWSALPEPSDDSTRARVRLAAGHPGLRAKAWQNNDRTAEVVVAALLADGVPRLAARVAAGACLGALTAALFDWAEDESGEPLGARVVSSLEQLEQLEQLERLAPCEGRPDGGAARPATSSRAGDAGNAVGAGDAGDAAGADADRPEGPR